MPPLLAELHTVGPTTVRFQVYQLRVRLLAVRGGSTHTRGDEEKNSDLDKPPSYAYLGRLIASLCPVR